MEIVKKKIDSVDVYEINGKLDVVGSQKAQDTIIPSISGGAKLIIDMSNCDYCASSGLRMLLITAKQSALANSKTILAGVQTMVWDVIVMTGFEDVLEAYPTQKEALAALQD